MLIGSRIREIRKAQGLTQREVAERGGMLPAYVSRVEHNHSTPSVESLETFARALGVPLYALFKDEAFARELQTQKPEPGRQENIIPPRLLCVLAKLNRRSRLLLLDLADGLAIKRGRPRARRARKPAC